MRGRSEVTDVTLLGARNSGRCNLDFQSCDRPPKSSARTHAPRLTAHVTTLTISAHGCPVLTNVAGAVRSTPARVAASPEKCCDECRCPPTLTQQTLTQARIPSRTPQSS